MRQEMGHEFLARMGKSRLRPAGRTGTEWLLAHLKLTPESRLLEVACNRGISTLSLAERFPCKIIGLDLSEDNVRQARERAATAEESLRKRLDFVVGDATKLPFEDNSFDAVINEAMLTMLPPKLRAAALGEYLRVLKPGGLLLTHDLSFLEEDRKLRYDLSRTIKVDVYPQTRDHWREAFEEAGFEVPEIKNAAVSLLSPHGLLWDEGFLPTIRFLRKVNRKENREMFRGMRNFFFRHRKIVRAIMLIGRKPE